MKAPHPTRGWAYTPGFEGHLVTEDFATQIHINALGLRDRPVDLDNRQERRILAIGSSFTSGIGVESHETWVAEFERLINRRAGGTGTFRVVNAGVNAYNLEQMRLTAEELTPLIKPELVVAGVFMGDAERLANPYVFFNGTTVRSDALDRLVALPDGFLYSPFHRPWAIRLDMWLGRHFRFGAHLAKLLQALREKRVWQTTHKNGETADEHPHLGLFLAEVDALTSSAEALGTSLIVLLINGQQKDGTFIDDTLLSESIKARCVKHGALVVDPLPALTREAAGEAVFRFENDGHWTARAHAIAARELTTQVVERGLL